MYIIPSYPMLASTATTLMLSVIFIVLSRQSRKTYMRLWGISWMVCSLLFLLDFLNLNTSLVETAYIMLRQMLTLAASYLFLMGTAHFFQIRLPDILSLAAALSIVSMALYPACPAFYSIAIIPNVMFCSGMLIASGCMFITISWTQKLPEKFLASFLIIAWSIVTNHFGFSLKNSTIAVSTYFIGLFTVNLLMLTLIIIYFKKLRFIDTRNSMRFRLLVENSSDAMFLYDYKKMGFEYISPGISDLIGISDSQLYDIPERFFDFITVEKKNKEIINIFSTPITNPGSGVLCLYKDDVIEKWSEIHYIPIRDRTYTVSAVEGILRDISERRRMEARLDAAAQARKELLENISHEIKTPVTLIQGYTESLLDKVVPPETTDTYLKMISSKAMMLATLIDDLSQVSHVNSQDLEYRFYEQSASELFEDIMNQCVFHISSSGHIPAISSDIDSNAILIADPYRIQQVVSNMINNAIRHTPEGGRISVACKTYFNEELMHIDEEKENPNIPDGDLLFTVSDTGDGIDEGDLENIFKRNFTRGRQSTLSPRSGLGLFISKQIITQHSGTITAKNNQYGGAEISFTLPYYK